ncbi:hypothetical protein IJT93_03440 [bacterium]|nr:hypothetical protein [bacterium]
MSVTYYRYGTVEYEDVLKSATVLTRPEVSPENEGKLIIIKGRIKLTKIIRDKDYNEKFKSPSVTRCIEREHRGKTTTWEIESKTEFIGGAKLGSFVLDESVIKDIPHNDERIIKLQSDQRLRYEYTNFSKGSANSTLIGIQKGHALVRDNRIKLGCFFEGKCNVQQMKAQSEENYKYRRIFAIAFFVLGLINGLAFWAIFRSLISKRIDEENDSYLEEQNYRQYYPD